MLFGSLALNNYSVPRMTMDIDIVIELREESIESFLQIFDDNYYLNPDTVVEETKRLGMFNVIDKTTGFKVDFILRKNNEFREHEFNRKKRMRILNFDVWMVSLEDLVISKIEWIQQLQSDKQITDIKNLMDNPKADKTYIMNWCTQLNLKTFDLF